MPKINFKKKPNLLGLNTPDRFKKQTLKTSLRNVAMTARPRCLGGHR